MGGIFRGVRCNDCKPDRICSFHLSILEAERQERQDRQRAETRTKQPAAPIEQEADSESIKSLTLRDAKKLGWVISESHKPDLADLGGGFFEVRPGRLSAEKTLANQFDHPYTHRIELGTKSTNEWPSLKKKLLAEIERVENLHAQRAAAFRAANEGEQVYG